MSLWKLPDLIDIPNLQILMDRFYAATGIPVGIIASGGEILVATGWQDICTKFHRTHPVTAERCRQSDDYIKTHLSANTYVQYKCCNGLWDLAVPIIIAEEHVATLFLGQFFYDDEEIDSMFFRDQALEFDFDLDTYMAALRGIPVFSREEIRLIMDFYASFVGFIVTMGIARHRQTEIGKTLRLSEERHRTLFQSANDAIFTICDGRIVNCNKKTLEMFRCTADELIGKTIEEVSTSIQPDGNKTTAKSRDLVTSAMGGTPQIFEWRHQRNDGTLFDAEVSLNRLEYQEKVELMAIVRDITERMLVEEAQREARDNLEKRVAERTEELAKTIEVLTSEIGERQRAEENLKAETAERLQAMEELRNKDRILMQQSRLAAMGEMIGNIAHQWRQPLNNLGLIMQQVQLCHGDDGFSKELLDESVDRSMDIIQHMSGTIDDFRNYFRPDKVKVEFKALNEITKVLTLIEAGFTNQHIKIEVNPMANPVIHGYPNEYSQALLNILINARDAFMKRCTVNPQIWIKVSSDDGNAVVTITDNAGGIPENILHKIFDPYFTTKGPDKGTGVGLFMSKTIIEKNMNGSLTIRNTGNGAEFRIATEACEPAPC